MADLIHHYKEREPEETIQIIKNFFTSRGFKIYQNSFTSSEANTYSNSIRLEYNNQEILHTNGKGLTPLYAEASGYAELYERFCAYPRISNSFLRNQLLVNPHYLENRELLQNQYIYYTISHLTPEVNDEYIQKFLDIYHNGKYSCNKYLSLDNEEDFLYQNLVDAADLVGTTGFAAGNTLEEALVQGISEYFERLAIKSFCNEACKFKKFYYINNNNLPEQIKERVEILENLNYLVRIYDLSYTYGLPVCMLYVCKKDLNLFHICFGAAPTFAIAAERCITEIYQGSYRLPVRPRLMAPSENFSHEEMTSDYFCSSHIHDHIYIHEACLLNSIEVDNFNSQYFIDKEQLDQKTLLNHLIKISQVADLQLFYTNISLCKDMYAIHIISKKKIMNQHEYKYQFLKEYTKEQQIKIFNCFYEIVMFGKRIFLNHEEYKTQDLENLIRFVLNNINTEEELSGLYRFLKKDIFKPYTLISGANNFIPLFHIIFNRLAEIEINESFSLRNIYEKYLMYYIYLEKNYSFSQIKKMFEAINFDIEEYKIDNFTPIFLIEKIFIEPAIKIYNSTDYKTFINNLTKID